MDSNAGHIPFPNYKEQKLLEIGVEKPLEIRAGDLETFTPNTYQGGICNWFVGSRIQVRPIVSTVDMSLKSCGLTFGKLLFKIYIQ